LLFATVVGAASGVFFAYQQAKVYQSTASVLLNPDPAIAAGTGPAAADAAARYDATQAQVAHTAKVAALALRRADAADLRVQDFLDDSSVSPDASSNILSFTARSATPSKSRALANAFAQAYVQFRRSASTESVNRRMGQLNEQVRHLYKQLNNERASGAPTTATFQQIFAVNAQRTQLQDLELFQDGPSLSEPAISSTQVQRKILQDGIAGGLLGLVIGIALASIAEALDTRVRSSDEATQWLGLSLLARIPEPPSTKRLAMMGNADSEQGEAYRKLRVAFDIANQSRHARTVAVTSAVEQEGKSTTVANLAVALALAGRRVCLIDLDLRRPFLDRFFGVPREPGATDAMLGHASAEEVAHPIPLVEPSPVPRSNGNGSSTTGNGALFVIPSGQLPPNPAELLESGVLRRLLSEVVPRCDLVLIDSAPLVPVSDGLTLANQVDGLMVVVGMSTANRSVMRELRRTLDLCNSQALGLVATGADEEGRGGRYGYGYDYGRLASVRGETSEAKTLA